MKELQEIGFPYPYEIEESPDKRFTLLIVTVPCHVQEHFILDDDIREVYVAEDPAVAEWLNKAKSFVDGIQVRY